MASAAVIQRRNVIGGRTDCYDTIVAAGAATSVYAYMVEGYAGEGFKVVRVVARRAVVGSRQVVERLAGADLAVMAGCAVIDNAVVLEARRGKLFCVVTDGTVLGRRQVGSIFPGADNTVMAGGTIPHDAGVIEVTAGERAGRVAYGAIFVCRHMVI